MTDWIWVASSRVGERTSAVELSITLLRAGFSRTLRLAHSCINDLEYRDGEGCCLSGSGLRLSNGVATFADLHNRTRLHSRRRLVSICVDAAQQVLFQVHGLEGRSHCNLFRGVELHLLFGISINSVRHGERVSYKT